MASSSAASSVSEGGSETQSDTRSGSGPRIINAPEDNASAYEQQAPIGATLYDRLAAPFEVHFEDTRSGVAITYITGEQVASRLNLVLGLDGWKFTVPQAGYDQDADEMWCLGRLEIQAGIGGTWVVREQYGSCKVKRSKPPCGYLADGNGDICGRRAADHSNTGRDRVTDHRYREIGRGQPLDIGFDKKGAATDALKKCASLIGVGLYLLAKKGGVRNEVATRAAQRRAPAQASNGADRAPAKPVAPAQIRCKQLVCAAQLSGGRCGDLHLVHPKQADHEFAEGECGVAIERTEIDGKVLEPFQFVNEYTMKRFKKPYCRRHYDAHVEAEERR